ncbi:hypothetical protein ENKO_212 [Klebsiella phage fENko-Kae01]|nr:hypothetical protein 7t3_0377 [Salmonella phage 7t3]
MKNVRNFLFASYLNFQVSMKLNPILTVALGAMCVVFLFSILSIFGL